MDSCAGRPAGFSLTAGGGMGVCMWRGCAWVCEEASGSVDAPGSGSLLFLCSVRQIDRVTPLTFASTR